ncbi:unnamed protein product [Macrosiphum euphorbiae]|uniref:Uncharacterized protein n=1 Tax=Macrosiphum euphorbiae TaxID=13131 RepID=A0AAV0XLH0_9HEMI|nr:unnamed protein product [Macrosiphum euphorbiae]
MHECHSSSAYRSQSQPRPDIVYRIRTNNFIWAKTCTSDQALRVNRFQQEAVPMTKILQLYRYDRSDFAGTLVKSLPSTATANSVPNR